MIDKVVSVNASEAIEALMSAQGRTKRSLAQELEITPQALNKRLSGDMKVSSLCQMADLLGYDVALVPKAAANEDSLLLD